MAKRTASPKSQPFEPVKVDEASQAILRKAARLLSADGWHPRDDARSLTGSISKAAHALIPADEAVRLRALAAVNGILSARLRQRYPQVDRDAWEQEDARQPEDVVALVASTSWPWPSSDMLSPVETTIEAYMAIQRVNAPSITAAELQAKARAAFPKDWAIIGALEMLSEGVLRHA